MRSSTSPKREASSGSSRTRSPTCSATTSFSASTCFISVYMLTTVIMCPPRERLDLARSKHPLKNCFHGY